MPGSTKQPVVISLEQALSLPYGTLRLVHLGWRVIRIEPTPLPGRKSRGDPNRYIGRPFAGEDRHSYFVAPNAGKEALALNLKTPAGREVLQRLVGRLQADVFCTNTMPAHHAELGVDYATLKAARADLIWCSISAMGLKYPDVPGYDPALQALCGYMDLTGERTAPPTQCGPPLIDLKAGDEFFAQVMHAMLERERGHGGRQIDISMARAAVSWLHTFLPMLDMGSPPDEVRRNGNRHRQFIPVNAYPTADGFIYVAIGSDAQWARFVACPMFAALAEARFSTNEGRRADQEELHRRIAALTGAHPGAEIAAVLAEAAIPHSPITPIEQVADLPFVQETRLVTRTPDGRQVRLPPAAVETDWLARHGGELPFSPAYGEHTSCVLAEAGFAEREIAALRRDGVVA